MRRNIFWAIIVVVAALLQTTWLDVFRVQDVLPNLTLLLVIYFAIVDGEERAMFTGVLGGMFQDVAGDVTLGHHVICHVIVGYITGRIVVRLVTGHPAVKVGLVFCGALLYGFLYTIIQYIQDPGTRAINMLLTAVLPAVFYTALVTPLVFYIVGRILSFASPREEEIS